MKKGKVMRLFEALIPLILLLTLLSFLIFRANRPHWMTFLLGFAVLMALAHPFLEGYRWQMVPAFVLTVVNFLLSAPAIIFRTDPKAATSALERSDEDDGKSMVQIHLKVIGLWVSSSLCVVYRICT